MRVLFIDLYHFSLSCEVYCHSIPNILINLDIGFWTAEIHGVHE